MNFKIYRYIDPSRIRDPKETPDDVIFPEQLNVYLPKKSFIALGERVKTLYYTPESNYSEPVIRVTYVFNRDEEGYLTNKVKTISWTLEDGSWSSSNKELRISVNDTLAKKEELTRRRVNIVSELKTLAEQMGVREYMTALFDKYATDSYNYERSGSGKLWRAIQADQELSFLSSTLPNGRNAREAIVQYLQIGVIE